MVRGFGWKVMERLVIGMIVVRPVDWSTISIGLKRSLMVSEFHCVMFDGDKSKYKWTTFWDYSFSKWLKLIVMFLLYLQNDAPEGSLSTGKHT